MFGRLKSLYNNTKDKSISFVVEKTANYYIKDYGKMLNFKLDSENKKVFLEIMLKGEAESLKVEIKDYLIIEKEGKEFLKFTEIDTSREWINVILETFVKDKFNEIEIPKEYSKLLKMVV